MKINADMLRGILDCMHAEADARDKHSAQIRSIVTAAKDKGFDTKAVRKVFVRERMDEAERAKQDDLLETYEGALGGKGRALVAIAAGEPVGSAAKANGVHRATLARARHVAKQVSNATPAHDPETGEVLAAQPSTETPAETQHAVNDPVAETKSCGGRGYQDNPAPHGLAPSEKGLATSNTPSPLPLGGTGDGRDVGNVVKPESDPESAPRPTPPQDPPAEQSIDLTIPNFLDRRLMASKGMG